MTDLDAIKQRLEEAFQPNKYHLIKEVIRDDLRWLIAEVERLRAAAANPPRTIHITGSIRGGDGKADGSGGGDVIITGDLVAEVERLRAELDELKEHHKHAAWERDEYD